MIMSEYMELTKEQRLKIDKLYIEEMNQRFPLLKSEIVMEFEEFLKTADNIIKSKI